jgi:hypothetical protein
MTMASSAGLAAIIYYAVVYPPITNVAHVVAVIVALQILCQENKESKVVLIEQFKLD